jgi:hypothetical protein
LIKNYQYNDSLFIRHYHLRGRDSGSSFCGVSGAAQLQVAAAINKNKQCSTAVITHSYCSNPSYTYKDFVDCK